MPILMIYCHPAKQMYAIAGEQCAMQNNEE